MRSDGSSNEERLRTGRRYRTDRTEGISDGVFAVSLTLLILDVRPPEGGVSQLVHGLVLIAPRLGTFALSFAIVAYYWLVHHLIFASLRGVKVALIWANMLFLFTIAVLPFSTAVLGRYALAPVALAVMVPISPRVRPRLQVCCSSRTVLTSQNNLQSANGATLCGVSGFS
jgi:uncharacterized membrane protein